MQLWDKKAFVTNLEINLGLIHLTMGESVEHNYLETVGT